MTRLTRLAGGTRPTALLLMATTTLALAACGGGGGNADQDAAKAQLAAIKSAEAQAAAASPSATPDSATPADSSSPSESPSSGASLTSTGSGADPSDYDVCALLPPADATSFAQAHMLTGFAATRTNLEIPESSACMVSFTPQAGSGATDITVVVQSAAFFSQYQDGRKVSGLGDEAYDDGSTPAVRVGNLVIAINENDFPDAVGLDLLRTMVPNLK